MRTAANRLIAVLALSAMAAAWPVQAGPAENAQTIAPLLDAQTVLVVRLDLARVDLDAVFALARGAGGEEFPETQVVQQMAAGLLDGFAQAGAREMYMLVSLADAVPTQGKPFVLAVPLPDGSDADAILALLRSGGFQAEPIRGFACAGRPEALDRLRSAEPCPRPEVAQAFDAAGDTTCQVLFVWTADQRRAIEEVRPTLPDRAGGGPATVLSRGIIWAAMGLDFPATPACRVVIQSAAPAGAAAMTEWLEAMKARVVQDEEVTRLVPGLLDVLAVLRPAVEGDRIVIRLEEAIRIGMPAMAQAAEVAREDALRSISMSRMHNIFLALAMWSNDHAAEWPESLDALVPAGYLDDPTMLRDPWGRPYVYVRAAKNTPPGTAVIHEQFDEWPARGVNVGYADGAVETITDRARFEQVLRDGRWQPGQ